MKRSAFTYPQTFVRGCLVRLQVRFALAAGVGLVVVVIAGMAARLSLQLGAHFPFRASGVFVAIMAVATALVGPYHPFARIGPANMVTIGRVILLALLAGGVPEPPSRRIAWATIAAGTFLAVLDGVDGSLARRSRMSSRFGARFDMETDALFILVLSVIVWQHGKAGAWVLIGGLLRYAFVAAKWLLPWMARPLDPTFRGKAMAVAHMVGLLVALGPIIPTPLSAMAAAVTLAALVWSFAIDFRRLWQEEL